MKKKETPASSIPLNQCDVCGEAKFAFGFTSVTGRDGSASRNLCAACCLREFARRMGVKEPEVADFQPLTVHDSLGKAHTFHFAVRLTTGLDIHAFELIDGYPGGYKFWVLEHPETPVHELHAKLVAKIKAGLAVRYIRSTDFGFGQAKNYIHGSALNGRIEERADSTPVVVVDGIEYTWEEFGQCLTKYTGFDFRLECYSACEEERDISPKPDRPDHLWWLPREPHGDEERTYQ